MASIEENELPHTILSRIMKRALIENMNIQKEAKTALAKSASVFINYLAATANDLTRSRHQKTIMPQDVIAAMETIEFPEFIPKMKEELAAFQQKTKEKKDSKKVPNKLPSTPDREHVDPTRSDMVTPSDNEENEGERSSVVSEISAVTSKRKASSTNNDALPRSKSHRSDSATSVAENVRLTDELGSDVQLDAGAERKGDETEEEEGGYEDEDEDLNG